MGSWGVPLARIFFYPLPILAQLRKCQVMGRLAALRLQILVVWGDLEKWERMIIFADNFEF